MNCNDFVLRNGHKEGSYLYVAVLQLYISEKNYAFKNILGVYFWESIHRASIRLQLQALFCG